MGDFRDSGLPGAVAVSESGRVGAMDAAMVSRKRRYENLRDPIELDPAALGAMIKSIERAGELQLYEGLPHQTWEREVLAVELATKSVREIGRYPFYSAPLNLASEDQVKLRLLLQSSGMYRGYTGLKYCGGFHPDYCVCWENGTSACELLVCFGCCEMRAFGSGIEAIYDGGERFSQLKDALQRFRAQRPARVYPKVDLTREPDRRERDLTFYNGLGPEDPTRPCQAEGCQRGSVRFAVLCRKHHFEQIEKRNCVFDH